MDVDVVLSGTDDEVAAVEVDASVSSSSRQEYSNDWISQTPYSRMDSRFPLLLES